MFILLCKEMLCSAVLQRHLSRYLLILFYPFDTSVTRNLPASSSLSTRHIFSLYPFIFFGGFFFSSFFNNIQKRKKSFISFFLSPRFNVLFIPPDFVAIPSVHPPPDLWLHLALGWLGWLACYFLFGLVGGKPLLSFVAVVRISSCLSIPFNNNK